MRSKAHTVICGPGLAVGLGLLLVAAVAECRADTALGADRMNEILVDANRLFEQANEVAATDAVGASNLYSKAILRYQRIVREGDIENGRLYYNIGNAYFRMKDVGRAILNYRRAARYIPNDPNLQQNLQYARSRRADRVEENQRKKVLQTLFFWHYDLSARARSMIFAIGFTCIWLFAGLRLFIRRGFLTWLAALNAAVAILFLASLSLEVMQAHRTRVGVILAGEVIARKGDSVSYEPSFRDPLHAGTEFTLVEDRADWYQIELTDTRRCWVPARSVGLVDGAGRMFDVGNSN